MLKRFVLGLGATVLGLGMLGHIADASAETVAACIGGDGNIKISATGKCPPNQTLLILNTGAAGAGALQVYDANGKVVGPFAGPNSVTINPAGTQFMTLQLVPTVVDGGAGFSGFQDTWMAPPSYMYTTPDCSGTRYQSYGTTVVGGKLYYAELPLQDITIQSVDSPMWNMDGTYTLTCMNMTFGMPNTTMKAGVATSLDLPALGFLPPFTVR